MKKLLLLMGLALPLGWCSCSTPAGPHAFHEQAELVIASLDAKTGKIIAPTKFERTENTHVLDEARAFIPQGTAVVILEGYSEPVPGPVFDSRSAIWFVGLRNLGYRHIVFVKGRGVDDPHNLPVVADYK